MWLGKPATGTVVGIASMHVIFHYIILLDEPHFSEGEYHRAVVCGGPQLESEDGSYDWKLPHEMWGKYTSPSGMDL
jgi:hypothetical protein